MYHFINLHFVVKLIENLKTQFIWRQKQHMNFFLVLPPRLPPPPPNNPKPWSFLQVVLFCKMWDDKTVSSQELLNENTLHHHLTLYSKGPYVQGSHVFHPKELKYEPRNNINYCLQHWLEDLSLQRKRVIAYTNLYVSVMNIQYWNNPFSNWMSEQNPLPQG